MRHPFATLACAFLFALPAGAHEATPSPVQFSYSKEAFRPWSIDTGWIPADGPVRTRFIGFVGGGMSSSASGAVHLSWPQSSLWADAADGAGQLSMDLGVELQTYLHLELQIPDGPLIVWEGPIPLFPGFDYRFANASAFNPFLLEGQDPASVLVTDNIQQTELYSLSLTDLIIPIPGVSGEIEVTAGGLLDTVMRGARLSFPEGDLLQHGALLPAPLPPGPYYQTTVRYDADVTYQGTLLLQPAVVLHLGPLEWELAQFDLPVPLSPVNETWQFDTKTVGFQVPRVTASVVESGQAIGPGDTVDFGAARSRTVRLTNAGAVTVAGTASVSGDGFSLGGAGVVVLLPGQSADLSIAYGRTFAGTGALSIDTNDPAGAIAVALQASDPTQPPPDAGTPPPDAGTPRPDAGTGPDPVPDGGTSGPQDPPVDLPGCGCSSAGGAAPLALLVLVVLALVRRRQRTADQTGTCQRA